MKFLATLAAIAVSTQAVDLAAEVATEAAAGSGYNGAIVPTKYNDAVHDFNLNDPFTDQECYQKQVDIYSDQIIAIEALRLESLQMQQKLNQAEWDFKANGDKIAENKDKIWANANAALRTKGKIEVLYEDVNDVADCLSRQW